MTVAICYAATVSSLAVPAGATGTATLGTSIWTSHESADPLAEAAKEWAASTDYAGKSRGDVSVCALVCAVVGAVVGAVLDAVLRLLCALLPATGGSAFRGSTG